MSKECKCYLLPYHEKFIDNCNCPCHNPQEPEEKLKEHSEDFIATFAEIRSGKNFQKSVEMLDQEISKAVESRNEEIKGWAERNFKDRAIEFDEAFGYNKALQDLLEFLNKK